MAILQSNLAHGFFNFSYLRYHRFICHVFGHLDGSSGPQDWDVLTGALVGTLGCLSLLVAASLVIRFCVCPANRRARRAASERAAAAAAAVDGGRIRKVELPSPVPIGDGDIAVGGGGGGGAGGGSLSDPFGVEAVVDGGEISLGLLEGVPQRAAAISATTTAQQRQQEGVRKGILKHPAAATGEGIMIPPDGATAGMIPPPPFPGAKQPYFDT